MACPSFFVKRMSHISIFHSNAVYTRRRYFSKDIKMTYIMKNFRSIKYLFFIFLSLAATACGGGAGGAPVSPIVNPVINYPLPEMRILVIGQSISSNCNEYVYPAVENVMQVSKDGSIKAASDPFEWADCKKGSMWMPLGKKIIESGLARKVIFMPLGMAATKVEDWQAGGGAFSKLNNAVALIQAQGINFDFAFWHQGSSNSGMDKASYMGHLNSVIEYTNSKVKISRWLIAIHSRCAGVYDRSIESAQLSIANAPSLNRYPGPNNNLLGDEYRFDGCHLNEKGQEKMASMWLDSIRNVLR